MVQSTFIRFGDPVSAESPWRFVELVRRIRTEFRLDWQGIHGAPHWARVMHHGLALARGNGANPTVVRLFALLHDSQRRNDGHDPQHGRRAGDFCCELSKDGVLRLSGDELELLVMACQGHSDGLREAHPTVQTCWDADRLDLGRVGVRPDPRYLCTTTARCPERIERAWCWSRATTREHRRSRVVPQRCRD